MISIRIRGRYGHGQYFWEKVYIDLKVWVLNPGLFWFINLLQYKINYDELVASYTFKDVPWDDQK